MMLGVRRASVVTVLGRFVDDGLVAHGYARVRILDGARLGHGFVRVLRASGRVAPRGFRLAAS